MILFAFLIASVGLILYLLFFYESRRARMLKKVPGPIALPLFGNALDFNESNEFIFRMDVLGSILRPGMDVTWLGWKPFVGLYQAKYVEKVLSSTTHIDKSADYDFMMPWLGTGLLTSKGQKWFSRRKLLTPTFHFKILEDFLDVMNEQAMTLVKILGREEVGKVKKKGFDIFPYVTRCTLDIICETAMGKKINAQQQSDTDYGQALYRISELIQHRQHRPWLFPDFLWKLSPSGREEKKLLRILHGFTENVIREKRAELKEKRREETERNSKMENENNKKSQNDDDDDVYMKAKRRVAFLNLFLAQADDPAANLTDQDIREETDTFMFAGHDTTSANISWTTYLLGCYPEYQTKVFQELDSIFGDDRERPVTTQDMSQMKYLESCIKESLRLYPSVPIIARAINSDLEIDEQTIIPAGTSAFIMPYALHRDPKVFPEPEVFFPDRFFPENSVGRSPFAYVPFSAGPRNCIGQKFAQMEQKVILANIFRNFKVEAAERREDLILLAELILRPKNGLHIKITRRSTTP